MLLYYINKMVKNNEWNVKTAEFKGYVKSSLESIGKHLERHDDKFDKLYDRIERNENSIERLKVKMSIIATAAGAIAAFIFNWIKNVWR